VRETASRLDGVPTSGTNGPGNYWRQNSGELPHKTLKGYTTVPFSLAGTRLASHPT